MLKLSLVAIFLVACHAASILPPLPSGRIIGGEPADIEEAPYSVALLYDPLDIGRYGIMCSGAIITETIIVSSARCLDKTDTDKWRVHAGSPYVEIGGLNLEVKSIIIHESFNPQMDNDIGLIVTSIAIPMDGVTVAVITLPKEDAIIADDSEIFVTGYGSLVEGGPASGYLQDVILKAVNQAECVSLYADFNAVTERMICAGNMAGGQGVCDGDSGGPMVQNNTLVGITSWSKGCGVARQPAVGTRITSMIPWILGHLPKTTY